MQKKILFFLLIFILALTANASAVRELNGDNLEFEQTEQGQIFTATGNVELIYDQLRITAADEGIYRRYNGEIEFRNNVELFYQEFEAEAVELTGNLEAEVFHLIEEAEVRGQNSLLRADKIDIYRAEDRIEVRGNGYLEYNDFWAEADQITYHLDQELILLEGNVRGERNGESFSSQSAEIDQQTEEVQLRGQATLRFSEDQEIQDPESSDSETVEE
ncbi:lipopolysaccharide export system protein LptA [Halanaerobium saccharolyticum]|uniref:Lipopolysaccharide export system protein LptA n=1 Tax=Halanaerobium saccharolyticum TaxID=43595 RepID=A0A4R7Z8M8_9FIRM|nr:LptA/OstA family protein [Halanaerobium saccharolyticum]RAK09793.1 lipopolysaccharide export system protein LptA [Halanaerobium saccharolyticum]TDW07355.1 lipopolysaccharide export system protein LptA [Halanaerobium saccharolyticum]TDX61234.1 lipopolysaccharide export system protein LptA [Halanaerobium saccharolyticum]